jgi:hypothetical protein
MSIIVPNILYHYNGRKATGKYGENTFFTLIIAVTGGKGKSHSAIVGAISRDTD